MSDDLTFQRAQQNMLQRLGQTEVKEVPIYVTGAWTPTLVGSTIAGTFTYTVNSGTYTRHGNTVFVRGRITIAVVTVAPTGNLSIAGLPLAAATLTSGNPGGAYFDYWSLIGLGGGANTYLGGWIQNAASAIALTVSQNAGGGAAFLTGAVAAVAANTDLLFVGQYQV